ncbi:phospholipid/cholesterol/gamma-HCH transport system substrate-binding protein [Nocardioides sp. J9]|uniref:MCE family protein n=1 Tax=Nocardioides sp. J9 TaxID=935844 RepID=UPI0011AA4416|nr:MCE family protein [Nocardioides sp. J9]TWG94923.1 phospholipid/cholesterol/gamma-HCH transport system substrate-binding protein [Nocardioides sp. J9]
MRRARVGMALLGAAFALSSCRFDGIDSLQLPGGKGTGDDAMVVVAEIPDVGTLTTNAQVKVDDIAVGTVTKVEVRDWHAELTMSIEPDVELPANAIARIGLNSLLGSAFVELAEPARAEGRLGDGDRIPLERGFANASTEQVMSSASLALNGGGLEQVATITSELNRVVGGSDRAIADLLPRLDSFLTALDDQTGDILSSVRSLSKVSKRFADSRSVITQALDEAGPALEVLSKHRPALIKALKQLTRLSAVATPFVEQAREDLVADLRNLAPVLSSVAESGDIAASALSHAITFPFAPETVNDACLGDYCNIMITVDLTTKSLVNGIVRPDGSIGVPGLPLLPDVGKLFSQALGGLLGPLDPAARTQQATAKNAAPATGATGAGGATEKKATPAPGVTLGSLLEALGLGRSAR